MLSNFQISSSVILCNSSESFEEQKIFVSSAKILKIILLEVLCRSLIYSKNNSGPSVATCNGFQARFGIAQHIAYD